MKFNTIENCNIFQKESNKVIKITEYNVFELFNYGVSAVTIRLLADKRIPPYNIYLNGINALAELNLLEAKKRSLCIAIKHMIENQDIKRTVFELMYCGISKSTCQNMNDKKLTIEKLRCLNKEELKKQYGLGSVISEKIKFFIKNIDEIISESNENIDTSLVLENIIKDNTKSSPITVFQLKQLLAKTDNYLLENFSKDYYKLQTKNKIKNGLFGIEYNFLSFRKYIENNFEERIAKIIVDRYEDKTLEFIAKKNGLTRERVRQICQKIKIKNINESLIEDRYKTIFEKYNWNKTAFCKALSESEITFNYLNERYIRGTEALDNLLKDPNISSDIKNKYKSFNKIIITSDGEMISNIDDFIRKVLIKYASDEIDIEKFTNLYNEEIKKYPELQLSTINSRNLEGRLVRSGYVILGANQKIRYYDYNGVSDTTITQLKELLKISAGFYTTEYLFRNNKQIMEEADIRNENELHNILKNKIDNEENDVCFLRMPNFLIGYKNKEDFIITKIREYSPILINDLLDILYEDYGHKKATMLSFLTANFAMYIKNGILDIETKKLTDTDVTLLKEKMKNDIYIIDDVNLILKNNGFKDINLILTSRNLSKVGYKLRGSYVVKNKYNSIYDYFEKRIDSELIIRIDENWLKISAIYNAINYYCRQLKIFQLTNTIYITDRKLEQLGVMKNDILNMIEQIKIKFSDKDYFSINNVMSEIDCSKYESIGLTEKFIEHIIFYLDEIKTLRINNNRLFSFSKKILNISNFMYDMVNKYSSISLYDLEKEIMTNYQISIPFEKLRAYLYNTEIFYSDILEKVYSEKNIYYEEVYDE